MLLDLALAANLAGAPLRRGRAGLTTPSVAQLVSQDHALAARTIRRHAADALDVLGRWLAGVLGAHAGLRLAEAAALRVEDVDFATGLVSPMVQWVDEPLKSEKSRTPIPIPKEMAHLLADAVRTGNGRTLVDDEWGKPVGPWTIERAIRAAREQVGLPEGFRFHDLRHYFASLLIASGLDVKGRPGAAAARVSQDDSTPTAISGRTGTTPHAPRSRPCTAPGADARHNLNGRICRSIAVASEAGRQFGGPFNQEECAMKVAAYHSSNPSDPDVYHDHDDCPTGRQIPARNRVAGTGGYRRCQQCVALG